MTSKQVLDRHASRLRKMICIINKLIDNAESNFGKGPMTKWDQASGIKYMADTMNNSMFYNKIE